MVLVPAQVAAWVGVYRRRPWARWLYLGVAAASAVIGLSAGAAQFSYEWAFPAAVNDVGSMVAGAVLALLFLSPAAELFETRAAVPGPAEGRPPGGAGVPGPAAG